MSTKVKSRPAARLKPVITAPMPQAAMILCAGLGTRMRPLTDDRPKPMVELNGRPMIDHAVRKLAESGIERLVVNLHYKGEVLKRHLEASCPKGIALAFSEEKDLLDTGGGIKKALPLLGASPFFVINGDVYWRDGTASTFARLAERWDAETMDALLLMVPAVSGFGYEGLGDFLMDPVGRLARRPESRVAPFLFGGLQLIHPRLFENAPEGPFSINRLWNRAIEQDRLYGLRHEGEWMHVGTPETLAGANARMAE